MTSLSAVVVCRDEAAVIDGCLARLGFADEIVVDVDDRTGDDTAERARRATPNVDLVRFETFAQAKNHAIDRAEGDWVLVVDADERVTTPLAREISATIGSGAADAYRIRIENYFYGSRVRHGGFRERPIRLFRRGAARYEGDIHETLRFTAADPRIATLENRLAHFSHRSVLHNLAKTSAYADIQAAEMLRAGHPPVRLRTFARVIGKELWRHTVVGRGYRDGMPGVIEALYQPFSMFTVYARLWELQQSPSIEERYRTLDATLP